MWSTCRRRGQNLPRGKSCQRCGQRVDDVNRTCPGASGVNEVANVSTTWSELAPGQVVSTLWPTCRRRGQNLPRAKSAYRPSRDPGTRRRVSASPTPSKYFSSKRWNAEPEGDTAANSVEQDLSFMSSGEPKIACADRPSTAKTAFTHSS